MINSLFYKFFANRSKVKQGASGLLALSLLSFLLSLLSSLFSLLSPLFSQGTVVSGQMACRVRAAGGVE
jgi:hypothetical protein